MTKEDIQTLEKTIKRHLRSLSGSVFNYAMDSHFQSNKKLPEDEDEETSVFEDLKILYLQLLCYFEAKGLLEYRKHFSEIISPKLSDQNKALEISPPLYSESDPFLTVFSMIEDFLSPFPNLKNYHNDEDELNRLEEILKNCSNILHHLDTKIINETSIYREVKWFLEVIYPSTRYLSKARFIKKFKTYHPDILIPELKVAVEFKLVRTGNIEEYIDQIKTDADNYDWDSEFQVFYAVLYIKDRKIATEKAIAQSWREKNFPEQWNLITVYD